MGRRKVSQKEYYMRVGLAVIEKALHTRFGLHERSPGEHSFLEGNYLSVYFGTFYMYMQKKKSLLYFWTF
jgi:hypothetical protein